MIGGDFLFINRLERLMKKLIAPRCQRSPCWTPAKILFAM